MRRKAGSAFVLLVIFVVTATLSAGAATAGPEGGSDPVPTPVGGNEPIGRHGEPGGHLPGSSRNVELLGRVDIAGAAPGRVADVSAFRNHAYLTVRDPAGCSDSGVAIIDISDPTEPVQVGFVDATEGSFPGEGSQVVDLRTPAFRGQVLVFNNEICAPGGNGGVSLWDVTDPLRPVVLAAHAGDATPPGAVSPLHEIHSAFAWQAGRRAFVVTVDNEERDDVDVLEITDPRNPALLTELDLNDLGVRQEDSPLGQVSGLHDMVVQKVRGTWTMLLSYWDGGWVLLDVDDPARPVLIADSDYPNPDTLTGISPSEGNAHQAEFSPDARFIIGTDEDFSPYRAIVRILTGPDAGEHHGGEFSWTVPLRDYRGGSIEGPTVYGGLGCPGGAGVPPASGLAAAPGEEKIVVLLRGVCFFSQKVEAAQNAGYDVVIVADHHAGATGGETPDAFACGAPGHEFTPTIAGLCIGHRAFHLLFAQTPVYDGDDAPPIATPGQRLSASSRFDGWGYVRLLNARTMEEVDAFAVEEALDPAFASGFGVLSVHEVAVDRWRKGRAYLSWYAAGLRVIEYGKRGLREIGHYVDPAGNDFWGVEAHRLPRGKRKLGKETLILASDRDSGLWIFRYTGR
jgi:hypothetical protein